MDWIQQWQSKLNKQNGVAPLVRTGGSRHTGLAALPYRNIHPKSKIVVLFSIKDVRGEVNAMGEKETAGSAFCGRNASLLI